MTNLCKFGFLLAALTMAVGVLDLWQVAQATVRTTSISPSYAAIGDTIVLTGNGLGATNVVVTVSGVRAQVLRATGNRVTFVVPPGVPSGVTTVTAEEATFLFYVNKLVAGRHQTGR